MKKITLTSLTLLLAGCGFHLRSGNDLPQGFNHIAVVSSVTTNRLAQQVASEFQQLGRQSQVDLKPASYQLNLSNISYSTSQPSIISSTTPTTYTFTYTFSYSISKGQQLIIPSQTISQSESVIAEPTQLITNSSFGQSFESPLRQQAINLLFDQLATDWAKAQFQKAKA